MFKFVKIYGCKVGVAVLFLFTSASIIS